VLAGILVLPVERRSITVRLFMSDPLRPRVTCHMITSVDGRIVTARWPNLGTGRREYEAVHAWYAADAWMCGRITMEPFAGGLRETGKRLAAAVTPTPRPDFVAPHATTSYAVAVDPSGRLAWESAEIDGDHVIAVLSERVADEYLEFLRARKVSYLFAGESDVDLKRALEKLTGVFGIRSVMLEGGGRINGAMLRDGLIDELSVLVAPVVDGAIGTPSLFDVSRDRAAFDPRRLALLAVERRADDVLWLRYQVK
jgi:2,5-diamino-6-(ribosylamino)-4(3H)-pyrimidinone 5'-phosphate reductase